jgi:mevalonate kinase
MSDESTELWLNHFTRVGFITHHKEQIETVRMLQRDSIEVLQIEKQRDPRNQLLILKMREDIRENTRLLSELGVGTPIIAAIKAKMRRYNNNSNSNPVIPFPATSESDLSEEKNE